jgi:hypothetical protein
MQDHTMIRGPRLFGGVLVCVCACGYVASARKVETLIRRHRRHKERYDHGD